MALTKRELSELRCAHCERPFETYPKDPSRDGPDDVPWVRGGIISVLDDGVEAHYHG